MQHSRGEVASLVAPSHCVGNNNAIYFILTCIHLKRQLYHGGDQKGFCAFEPAQCKTIGNDV